MAIVDTVKQDLKSKIHAQVFRNGDFLPTFQELADAYKTSTNSIYRAVKQLERENIVVAVRGSGTKVVFSSPSKDRKKNSDRYVGLVISEPGHSAATMQFLTGIQEGLEKYGCDCVTKFSHKEPEKEHKIVLELLKNGIRDIIIYPSIGPFAELKERIELYRKMNGRITLVNYYRTNLPVSSVGLDNYWGTYNLCRTMHKNGAKKFIFVSYELDKDFFDSSIYERTVAFREFVRENDLPLQIIYCPFDKSCECFIDNSSHDIFLKHIKQPGAAVVCMNNTIALVLQKIMFRERVNWPCGLYLGTFGNLDNFPCPYYEVRVDAYNFGYSLAEACITERNSCHGKRLVLDSKIITPSN